MGWVGGARRVGRDDEVVKASLSFGCFGWGLGCAREMERAGGWQSKEVVGGKGGCDAVLRWSWKRRETCFDTIIRAPFTITLGVGHFW